MILNAEKQKNQETKAHTELYYSETWGCPFLSSTAPHNLPDAAIIVSMATPYGFLFFSPWCFVSRSPEEMAPFSATSKRKAECRSACVHVCACVCVDTLTLTLCAGWSVWVESRDYKQNQCCTDACALLIHETTDLKQNKRTQSIAWTQSRTNSLRTVHKAASFSDTQACTKRKRLPSAN